MKIATSLFIASYLLTARPIGAQNVAVSATVAENISLKIQDGNAEVTNNLGCEIVTAMVRVGSQDYKAYTLSI